MRNGADDGSLIPLLYLHQWEEDWVNLATVCWSIPHVISQHSHSVAACWMGHLACFFYYWRKDFLPCPTCTEAPWPLSAVLSSSAGDQHLTQRLRYGYTKVLLSSKTKLSSQYPSSQHLTLFWQSLYIELMISESCQWWLWDPVPGSYHFHVWHRMHPVCVIFPRVYYLTLIYAEAHLPPFVHSHCVVRSSWEFLASTVAFDYSNYIVSSANLEVSLVTH